MNFTNISFVLQKVRWLNKVIKLLDLVIFNYFSFSLFLIILFQLVQRKSSKIPRINQRLKQNTEVLFVATVVLLNRNVSIRFFHISKYLLFLFSTLLYVVKLSSPFLYFENTSALNRSNCIHKKLCNDKIAANDSSFDSHFAMSSQTYTICQRCSLYSGV